MIESRSSSVRTAGLPDPIPVAAACTDRRQAPQERCSPPALAHRPAGPFHYALPPTTNAAEDKTEIPFLTTGISASRSRQIGTETWRKTVKPQLLATISPRLVLKRHESLSQNVADLSNNSAFGHNSKRRAA